MTASRMLNFSALDTTDTICTRCRATVQIVSAEGTCQICYASSRALAWGRPTSRLYHLPTSGREALLARVRAAAIELCAPRASYQRATICHDSWSGADLRGVARKWSANYKSSRDVAAGYVQAAADAIGVGVKWVGARRGNRDVDGNFQRSIRVELSQQRMVDRSCYSAAYPSIVVPADPRMIRFYREVEK